MKKIILVVLISILIGIAIVFFTSKKDAQTVLVPKPAQNQKTSPPTPKPTLQPLDANSNLLEELGKNTPPDFSTDFENLSL